eukprot:4256532-Pleurochrysis_carterae.AAC.1
MTGEASKRLRDRGAAGERWGIESLKKRGRAEACKARARECAQAFRRSVSCKPTHALLSASRSPGRQPDLRLTPAVGRVQLVQLR